MRKTPTLNGQVIAVRKERGLTQVALAKRLRINHADVVRIEQGWIPPRALRRHIAQALGVPQNQLFAPAIVLGRGE